MKKELFKSFVGLGVASVLLFSAVAFAQGEPSARDQALQNCVKIAASLERLNCFDQAMGTPAIIPVDPQVTSDLARPLMVQLVRENERKRPENFVGFIMSEKDELDSEGGLIGSRVIISAPALATATNNDEVRPVLAISCVLNITRFQLIADEPINEAMIDIQFFSDNQTMLGKSTWQVLDTGEIVDAGRGLHAISLIRPLIAQQRITVKSSYSPFNGLVFDMTNLAEYIQRERKACHW